MRTQPFIRLLFAVLALQLAVGLQTSVARAADFSLRAAVMAETMGADAAAMHDTDSTHSDSMHSGAVDGEHCPLHAKPTHKHDCCSSMGCQCQCANAPAALGMPAVGVILSARLLLPAGDARFVGARAEAHFRPPIT